MNVDELNIVIKVDSGNAIEGLDSIIAKITELNEVTGRGSNNIASLRDLADSMRLLGVAGRAISDIKLSGFENVYNGASMLGNINADLISEKINTISPALERLGQASTSFNADTKFMGASVSSLVKSLNSLTGLKPNGLDTAEPIFARLKVMLADFPRGVGREMINVANGLTQVSASMNKFVPPSTTSWQIFESFLRRISPALKEFGEDSLSGSNSIHHLSIALKNLNALAGETGLAENLRKVTVEISRFITTMNGAVSDADLERFARIAEALYQVSEAYKHLATAEQKAGASAYGYNRDTAAVSRTLNTFLSNLKKAAPQVISFGKKLAMIVTTPFRRFGAAVLSAGNAIRGFFQRLGRVAMLRFMRMMIMKVVTALKEGIQNLYAWSAAVDHSFAQAMDTISTAGLYLKNSIAAMFSPLIEAIAPVLDAIVDKVVAFINVVNQLFALLSGRSVYTAAIKSAKAYGDAAGGAAAAQEALNRSVLAFDELNRLNGPDNGGGGGGGGASAGEGAFEVRDISELAERLFTDEDWTWLGDLVTTKLTEQMERIDWNKIQTGVNGIATRISTFLNGAFGNTEFWNTLGVTIGEGINTITGFIDTFFQTTEWTTGGESFGSFLRSGIDTIDWEQLGRTITDVPRAITQWIHGFVSEWTIDDWTELGDSIADMVNSAFFNIDWATAIPDVVRLATGILHAINTAIQDINWHEMFEELKKGFQDADWDSFWAELKDLVFNTTPVWTIAIGIIVGKAVVETAAAGIRTMVVNAIAAKLASAFGGTAAGAAGGAGGAGIGGAIGGKLAAIGGSAAATGLIIPIAVTAAVAVTVVMSIARAKRQESIQRTANQDAQMYRNALNEALSEGLISTEAWNQGMQMTNELYDLYYSNLEKNPWDVFGTQFEAEAEAITQGLQNILYDTGYTTEHIHRNVSGKLGDTTEVTKKFIGDTASSFGGLKETVSGDVEDMTESVTTDTQNMSIHSGRYIEGLRDKTIGSLSTMKTDGSTYVEDLRKNVVDKLADAKTKGTKSIGDLTKDIGDKLSKTATNASTYGGDTGKNFADGISGKVNTVNTSVGKLVDKVKGLNLTDSGKKWGGDTGSKYSEGIETKISTVGTSVGKLTGKVGGLNLKDSAYTWGTDLGQKYADGINAKAPVVESAAKNTADKVSKYLHFSEPDEGPLANFHTFAPDMMRMYAQGIEDNKQLVMNQLQSLTADMSGVFANVGVNYNQTVETNYDGLIAALADREEAINVYIGNSKLDTVMARSTKRTDLRTGGR